MLNSDLQNQKFLEQVFNQRISAAGYVDYESVQDNFASDGIVAVIKHFDFVKYVSLLFELHSRLGDEEKVRWKRAFTRMYFVLGDPKKLLQKNPQAFLVSTENIGITPLLTQWGAKGYLQLCPLFKGELKKGDADTSSMKIGNDYRIEVLDTCSSLQELLVAVSHIVNESLIDKKIAKNSKIDLEFVKDFQQNDAQAKMIYVRVIRDESTAQYKVTGVLYETAK